MIDQYEFYHGAVIRSLIVNSSKPIAVDVSDFGGRINSFTLNGRVGVALKHSTKRVSPWQFTFSAEHIQEFQQLKSVCAEVFAILVCGHDGFVAVSYEQFSELLGANSDGQGWIRVSRNRNFMYSVSGSSQNNTYKIAAGLGAVSSSLIGSGAN